jgi:hypothetical protein
VRRSPAPREARRLGVAFAQRTKTRFARHGTKLARHRRVELEIIPVPARPPLRERQAGSVSRRIAASCAVALLFVGTNANASPDAADDGGRERGGFAAQPEGPAPDRPRETWLRRRDRWSFSIEGVTHAPLDVGFQAGVETPFRLRLFAGYGWVPAPYFDVLTGIARSVTDDARVEALLESSSYTGRGWRIQSGFRLFPNFGLYVDVGYARLDLSSSLELAELALLESIPVSGGYTADASLDLWLVEIGYQGTVAEHLVLGAGVGMVGMLDARTTVRPTGGAPDDPVLSDAAQHLDDALETYGFVPTLTLRLGYDLI